jgi:hypothetical protein
LESQPWFYGKIERPEAHRLLAPHPFGTFLVRQSENGMFALSIKLQDPNEFKHYRVKPMDNDGGAILRITLAARLSLSFVLPYFTMIVLIPSPFCSTRCRYVPLSSH